LRPTGRRSRSIVFRARIVPLRGVVVLLAQLLHGTASAEPFRSAVTVEKPVSQPSTVALNMTVDAEARRLLAEEYLNRRLSPVLLTRRGDDVRVALDPLASLLSDFKVISRTDVPGNHVRVVCEADVDAAAVVLRLVENRVLSFGSRGPRLLLAPAAGTSPEMLQALRARMTEVVGASGITVIAEEAAAPGVVGGRGSIDERAAHVRAAVDAGAHFVALLAVSPARAPSPVGGVVLDTSIRYTLLRAYDAAIVGEHVFQSERTSGVSYEMAVQRVLDKVGPAAARAIAGRVAEVLFSNGRVVDTTVQQGDVTVNVMLRPNPAATTAFLAFLRERGFHAALGTGRQTTGDRVPAERIVVNDHVSVEDLYALFADGSFGPSNALHASVFEHGADSLGVEIVDGSAKPANEPIQRLDARPTPASPENVTSAPRAPADTSAQAPAVVAAPRQIGSAPGVTVEKPGTAAATSRPSRDGPVASGGGATAARVATPLEFEFSEAFAVAAGSGQKR
jgi:hypothetical protein